VHRADHRVVRVFMCDDDPGFCAVVGFWLEDAEGIDLVGHALDRTRALEALTDVQPDVVLLDTMGHDGLGGVAVAEVREVAPRAVVVVYSGLPASVSPGFVEGEADLYLEKDSDPEHLLAALAQVAPRADRRLG
jgi:DNA-binding NarL/FixJ family response regulator